MKESTRLSPYESPHLTLVLFSTEDVLTASGNPDLGEWDTEL